MDARIKQLNSRIDRLEAEFERNRQQLLHLADENRRGTSDYDALLERNLHAGAWQPMEKAGLKS